MSCLKLYNELNGQYIKFQSVNQLFRKRNPDCIGELEKWYSATEKILKENNCLEKTLIAQFKGQLAIERMRKDKIMTKRKRELNAVNQLMEPTKTTLIKIIEPVSKKIEQSESIVKRMLLKKDFHWNEGLNYRDYILAVWRTLQNEDLTKDDVKKVLNLVSEDDVLLLISKYLRPKNKLD